MHGARVFSVTDDPVFPKRVMVRNRKGILTPLHPSIGSGTCLLCRQDPSKRQTRYVLVREIHFQQAPVSFEIQEKCVETSAVVAGPGVHAAVRTNSAVEKGRGEEAKLMAPYAITYSMSGTACSHYS